MVVNEERVSRRRTARRGAAAPAERADGPAEPGPIFPLGPPANQPWREGTVTRINELTTLLTWLYQRPDVSASPALIHGIEQHLEIARRAAADRHHWRSIIGATLGRAAGNIDAAEADLLRMAPPDYLLGQMSGLLAHVGRELAPKDPRRVRLEELAARLPPHPSAGRARQRGLRRKATITDAERTEIIGATRAASSEAVREQLRACSFRNILTLTAGLLMLMAVGVAVLGFVSPSRVPLCFSPSQDGTVTVVCPTATSHRAVASTGSGTGDSPQTQSDIDDVLRDTADRLDVFTVEALGLVAAALASAVALRGIRGSSEPFGLPLALAALKLPSGALTAVLGLLLMRGGFVPGLSALDSSAQILAWAVVFGYAQQIFTRMVDQQAHQILDNIRSKKSKVDPGEARTER